jgi:hypothetical protein
MNPKGKSHPGAGESCDCGLQVYGCLGDAANTPLRKAHTSCYMSFALKFLKDILENNNGLNIRDLINRYIK